MYKHILVAVAMDHSTNVDEALQIARALADEGARITALNVIDEIPTYVATQLPAELLANQRPEAVAKLKALLSGADDVHQEVVFGHAGRTIVSYAQENNVDCIVIASHRPGMQDYFLGSTATRVVRHAPCAVHVSR